jgi:hypothetical protein
LRWWSAWRPSRGAGESLLGLVCLLILTLYLDLVTLQLSPAGLTWEGLGRAVDEALVVIARITGD